MSVGRTKSAIRNYINFDFTVLRNHNGRMESSWGKSLESLHHISDYDLYWCVRFGNSWLYSFIHMQHHCIPISSGSNAFSSAYQTPLHSNFLGCEINLVNCLSNFYVLHQLGFRHLYPYSNRFIKLSSIMCYLFDFSLWLIVIKIVTLCSMPCEYVIVYRQPLHCDLIQLLWWVGGL